MSVKVRIPVPLRSLTGGREEVEVTGTTVREVIENLNSTFPGMRERILSGTDELNRFLTIFLNSQDIRLGEGLKTGVRDGDQLTILPLVAGGSEAGGSLSANGSDRYSRQVIFPEIGRTGQERLQNSSVVIVGCGALGTVAATALTRAGVGRIRLIDRDFIEYHNLQRQILFDEEDVRRQLPKAIAAQQHLAAINSTIEVEGIVSDVNYRNVERLIDGADVIVDGVDNLETRYLLNDASLKHRIPWVYGAAVSSDGMMMAVIPARTPCIRCLFPSLPPAGESATCDTAGVVNAAPMVIGALQATETMKILLGKETLGLVAVDVWTGAFSRLEVAPGPSSECPACQGEYEFLSARFGVRTTSLCGRNAVQVRASTKASLSFDELARRFAPLGDVNYNEFMLRFVVDGYEMVIFPDARAIVKGTGDESVARSLYAKYVGM
jgi:adenylyltransferase/sulfurtransferase